MHGRLAFSLNDDGTVTLRCDADAFFAHANQIRRLLTGTEGEDDEARAERGSAESRALEPQATSGEHDRGDLQAFWAATFPASGPAGRRDLSPAATEVLAAGFYLMRERGFDAFSRADLDEVLGALDPARVVSSGTLVHLAKRGWLERARRGVYRLTRRAIDRVESLRRLEAAQPADPPRVEPPPLPSIFGVSRFLREVPTARKWRRALLVAYFLHEHCGIAEFDRRLLEACFKRVRGVDLPGSLGALLSQVLTRQRRLLERGSRRGSYRLTASALEELRRNPRIAQADAIQRSIAVAKTG